MSLNIYIDTNIFLNSILNRDNNISKEVLFFLEQKGFNIILNDISIINIHYYISKSKTLLKDEIKDYINIFLKNYIIVAASEDILKNAINSNFSDFEDGVQYFCAKKTNANLIITNDKKGFKNSDIEVITAQDFFNNYIR